MAIYVTRKCPKCKYTFERMSTDWIAFGDPRVKCPKCGLIVLFKNIREWKLHHPLMKFWIIFRHYIFQNIAYTIGSVMLFFLLMALLLFFLDNSINDVIIEENRDVFWTFISIIAFIPISIYRHKEFIKEVTESNNRMNGENYAETMKGLVKK